METMNGQFSQILEGLMGDPKIAELISSLTKGSDEKKVSDSDGADRQEFSLPPSLLTKLPELLGGQSLEKQGKEGESSGGRRSALLKALRPYLSPRRRELLDKLQKLEGLAGIVNIISKGI